MKRIAISIALGLILLTACYFLIPTSDTGTSDLATQTDELLVVNANLEVKAGDLVTIDLSESTGIEYKWSLLPTEAAINFRVFDQGRVAVFSSGIPGEYLFFVSCHTETAVDHKILMVTVLPRQLTPDPEPAPDPSPDPDAPIDVKLASWLKTMGASKSDCAKLGQSFESIAAQIKAGVIPVDKITAATRESNHSALSDSKSDWTPFMANLQKEFVTRYKDGTLRTPEEYENLWKKIGLTLKKYAR